jgi:Fe-S cluster assembly protein SufD
MENQVLIDKFSAQFAAIQKNLNGKGESPFNKVRSDAMTHFERQGFPTPKHEEWKYSNLKKALKIDYNFHVQSSLSEEEIKSVPLSNLHGHVLYFVNGVYQEAYSDIVSPTDKLKIMTFKEAQEKIPELLEAHFSKHVNSEVEAFSALNTALANDGVVVYIADNQTLEEPIIMRMLGDVTTEDVGAIVRNLIIVGKNAEVKVAETYRTIGDKASFTNAVTEIHVGEDARVDYYKVQNENDLSTHVGTTQVHQLDRSYFYAATFTINGGFVRNNLNIILDGEHIETFMYGLYIPNERQHVDNHSVVDHRKPNSVSNELYKGILMDHSTGVFNGKIFVREDAQKTNAYQNCRNVIVSKDATMNTKPQLEIWADDVKCSHGATTGQLNDEAIFYMQSRGIPREEAIRLQLRAFAEDVVSKIKIDTIHEYLEGMIIEKLGE